MASTQLSIDENLWRETTDRIIEADRLPSRELQRECFEIMRNLIRLRDAMIGQLRSQPAAGPGYLHPRLASVNTAITLVAGCLFPDTSLHRSALEKAGKVLARDHESDPPAGKQPNDKGDHRDDDQ